jgi:AcrR family transcriptional regulator
MLVMEKNDNSTKQAIINAAEDEFIAKGYNGAKTTEIAKRAGVNHAMLHYYFETKEKLFNMVFQEKVRFLADSFYSTLDCGLPLFERLKIGIEAHFDIMSQNPRLPSFIYNEISTNPARKDLFVKALAPKLQKIIEDLRQLMKPEIEKGNIRNIEPIDIIINILSLNIFPFLGDPLFSALNEEMGIDHQNLLKHRKENNVELIFNSLRL